MWGRAAAAGGLVDAAIRRTPRVLGGLNGICLQVFHGPQDSLLARVAVVQAEEQCPWRHDEELARLSQRQGCKLENWPDYCYTRRCKLWFPPQP